MTDVDTAAERARRRARTVGVVTGVADQRAVLVAIGRELRFPGYYGRNLDALEECLRDLSWLPTGPVELVVDDAAFRVADPRGHATLLQVLREVAHDDGERPLRITLVPGAARDGGGPRPALS